MNNQMLIEAMIQKWRRELHKRKYVIIAGCIISLLLIAAYFWTISKRYISTEDAYINGNVAQIASRVGGEVKHLYVDNNQFVQKGQVLFELDRIPFEIAVEKAESQYVIDQAKWQNIETAFLRTKELVKRQVLSKQAGDDIHAKLKTAAAALKLSEALLKETKLQLSYTRIVAPTNGYVSNLSLREGNIISENQPLFSMIDNATFWIDANFKETELQHIKQNQMATIKIDMYPDKVFYGIVTSISGGSGTAFSLLPPQNATGNWVKVTQRVPVRVRILQVNDKYPLRIGTSASITIDLQSHYDTTLKTIS